ncbi:MAG: response regulator [Cyanobacteriota bacterium]|nr:response regulator [Cyanobacteriota bacterium]
MNKTVLADKRVLIVDDNSLNLFLLSHSLRRYVAEIETATSAIQALELITQFLPDILISDIAMPDMDGYSFIRQVRTIQSLEGRFIPAIALTGWFSEEEQAQALNAGFQLFISKPISINDLVEAMAQLFT